MQFQGYLYHVTRYEKKRVGDEIDFSNTQNYFAKEIFQQEFFIDDLDVNQIAQKKSFKDFTEQEEKISKLYINQSCLMIRELILESVRQELYPDLPSRFKCLFCTKTYNEAKNWLNAIRRMNNKNLPLQIIKLEANGIIFAGDGNLMLRNTYSLEKKVEMAKNYWQHKTNNLEEILFVGKAKVIEVLDEF